ncbi:MAG: T9SS type A sorting domain-containing protein [Bacteroidetes bacterium]|nr:T9SS type A sorting domain-containing protein [Bacteroidota bacterium]
MNSLRGLFIICLTICLHPFESAAQLCIDCGQGISGSFKASRDTSLISGNYDFDTFIIDEGVMVSIYGNQPLIIRCKTDAEINGILDLSGGNGEDGIPNLTGGNGGLANAGGFNGGAGIYNNAQAILAGINGNGPGYGNGGLNGSGAGAGFSVQGNACNFPGGIAYGDSIISQLFGGSGGGGGMARMGGVSAGGGAGGGILVLKSCTSLIIGLNGGIYSNGGDGGNGNYNGFPGGGGSGGTIYLAAKNIEIHGIVSSMGGAGGLDANNDSCFSSCSGSPGRIRIDSKELAIDGSILPSAYLHSLFYAGIRRAVNAKCHGTATGFIKTRANGGEKPYTYQWSNGGTSDEIDQLMAGTYTVTITDATGCSYTDQVSISQPSEIIPEVVSYPPTCESKNDGKLLFRATGGTPFPYQKTLFTTLWSNSSSNGIMFDITVNKKVKLKRITLSLPSSSLQQLSIFFKQGTMIGAETDSSQWQLVNSYSVTGMGSDEDTPLDISSLDELLPGRYAFYVYNHSGKINSVTSSVIGNTFNYDHVLTVHDGLSRDQSTSVFTASQKGAMNLAGGITYVVRQDDHFNYNYISNGINSPINDRLPDGVHQYVISDALGCLVSDTVTIPTAGKMNISLVEIKSPRCSYSTDGAIEMNAIPSLNEKFCPTSIPYSLPSNGMLLNFAVAQTIQLNGFDFYTSQSGQIHLYLKSGTYLGEENNSSAWTYLGLYPVTTVGSTGITPILLNNQQMLTPGTWSIYAYSDTDLFMNLDSVTLFSNADITFLQSMSRTGNTGAFLTSEKMNAHFAGTLRYFQTATAMDYQWNNTTHSNLINNLSGGTYTVTVTQNNECSVSKSYDLTAPAPITINEYITPETEEEQNGSIHVNVDGGTAPYYIQWINSGSTGNIIQQLPSGNYPVFIADSKGCIKNDTLYVNRITNPVKSEGQLAIAPNPGHGQFIVVKEVNGMEDCTLRIFDCLGRLTYKSETNILSLMTNGVNLSHYADGNYIIRVNDQDQIFNARLVIIR